MTKQLSSLADRFLDCLHAGVVEGAFDHLLHRRAPVAHTDPKVIAAWAEYVSPDEWLRLHGGTDQ